MGWQSHDPSTMDLLTIESKVERGQSLPDDAFSGPGYPRLEVSEKKRDLGMVAVVTPYSAYHKRCISRCKNLVQQAWDYSPGPFSSFVHEPVFDKDCLGPGWGRNRAVELFPEADWYLFLDADDLPKAHVFEAMNWVEHLTDIVWGHIEHRMMIEGKVRAWVRSGSLTEVDWNLIVARGHDAGCGVNNACFVRGGLARKFRWFEEMYTYEDIEMFLCWISHGTFQKTPFPLVMVDQLMPSTNHADKDGAKFRTRWVTMQTFWRTNGRRPLTPEILEFRNQARVSEDFYGN